MKAAIEFGIQNDTTGEYEEGYIDENGKMKYGEPFQPTQVTLVGFTEAAVGTIFNPNKVTIKVPVYREYNMINNRTLRVYVEHDGREIECNTEVFDKTRRIVET